MLVPWLPLPWDGDATLIPAHVVIGGPEANVAKADGLLAILAVVAWNRKRKEERHVSVILQFTVRNMYLVFIPVPGTEFLKSMGFPK